MNNEVKLNPEHHDDHLQGGEGEDQVQLPPEKYVNIKSNTVQNTMLITCMHKRSR